MDAHFSVINKKGIIISFFAMAFNGGIAAFSTAKLLSGGSKLWLLMVIFFVTIFLFTTIAMSQIVSAGIDVKRGVAIFQGPDGKSGRTPKFHIRELDKIALLNHNGHVIDIENDSLAGARIVFYLKDGSEKEYYPLTITKKQYKSIEDGFRNLLNELDNDRLFDE